MIAPMKKTSANWKSEIDQVERWVRAGDYKQAGRAAKQLLSESGLTDDQRERVKRLWDSMAVDRGALIAFGVTGLVLLFILLQYGI